MGTTRGGRLRDSLVLLIATLTLAWSPASVSTLAQQGRTPARVVAKSQSDFTVRPGPSVELQRPLRLSAGHVSTARTAKDLPELVRNLERSGGRAILQLDGPLTPARRSALEAAGVRLGGYIPENAFIADVSQADGKALKAIDFVRWQGEFEPAWKRDPRLGKREQASPARQALAKAGKLEVIVTLFEGAKPDPVVAVINALPRTPTVHLVDELAGNAFIVATIDSSLVDRLISIPDVQFIEETPDLSDRSNSNDRWIVQSNVPGVTPLYDQGLRGEDQVIGIIDGATGGLDINHCSFKDSINNSPGPGHRKVLAYNSPAGALTHATHVSATAAGDNGVDDDTRGVAWASKMVYAARPIFTEMGIYNALALHHTQGARVHSNSWGDDSVVWYTSLCRGIDSFVYDNEESLVCFAVTNSGFLKTPENAKNVLAIGASQGAPNQGSFCSGGVGPTADGRRKPEIFAPGCLTISAQSNTVCGTAQLTGTSMACPAVAGAAVLTRQYFESGFYPSGAANPGDGFTPSAALLKAALINSAVDMTGIAGFPSDQEGWGRVLADNALYFSGDARRLIVRDVRNVDGMLTGEIAALGVDVASSSEPLKITLSWTEPPATLGADVVQVNNLDLEVIDPTGAVYRGNVFMSGQSVAGGSADDRNNVEQVVIVAPMPGLWTIRVRAAGINVGAQGYALVATGELSEEAAPLAVAIEAPAPLIWAGTTLAIRVNVNAGDDILVAESPKLHFRFDGGAFSSLPLAHVAGDIYDVTLPAVACGDSPEMFATAAGVTSGVISDPPDQPSALIEVAVGSVTSVLFDDFESDNGWTGGVLGDSATSGQWVRVAPVGTGAQPGADHTPDPGSVCWITGQHVAGQVDGFADVDGGSTTLLSAPFDLTGITSPRLTYWRWFYTSTGGLEDTLRVDISHDNGGTWLNVETLGNTTARLQTLGGWFSHAFDPAALVPSLTANMRMRFVATDASPGSIVEAGIDDFEIVSFACLAPPFCEGDANGDLLVDFDDITSMLANWNATYVPGSAGLGDADNDGDVDFDDIIAVLANWGADCS